MTRRKESTTESLKRVRSALTLLKTSYNIAKCERDKLKSQVEEINKTLRKSTQDLSDMTKRYEALAALRDIQHSRATISDLKQSLNSSERNFQALKITSSRTIQQLNTALEIAHAQHREACHELHAIKHGAGAGYDTSADRTPYRRG